MNINIAQQEINFLIDQSIHEMDTLVLTNQYNLLLEYYNLPTVSKSKIEELKKNIIYTINRIQRKIKSIIRDFISSIENENIKSYTEHIRAKYNMTDSKNTAVTVKIKGPDISKRVGVVNVYGTAQNLVQYIVDAALIEEPSKIDISKSAHDIIQERFESIVFKPYRIGLSFSKNKHNNDSDLIADILGYTTKDNFVVETVDTAYAIDELTTITEFKKSVIQLERNADTVLNSMIKELKKYQNNEDTDKNNKDHLKQINIAYQCIMRGIKLISITISNTLKTINQRKAFAKSIINFAINVKKSKKNNNYSDGGVIDYTEDFGDEDEFDFEEESAMYNEIDFLNEDDLMLEEEELNLDLEACKTKKESKNVCEKCGKTLEKCECAKNK